MKIYTKILITTLPLVFFFLVATVGISYYFSRNALTYIAEEWLTTRALEAIKITKKHEAILHRYGLAEISASRVKAQMDAVKELSDIKIGEKGYILVVDTQGRIILHPDQYYIGLSVVNQNWFSLLKTQKTRLSVMLQNEKILAISDFFPEWGWFLLAVDPETEVYGLADRMKPYLLSLGVIAAVILSLALMLLSRRLLKPFQVLVQGAERIGEGELDTILSTQTHDEFADLAHVFNRMSIRLKETLDKLKYSEEYFRSLIENATDIVTITDSKGHFIYASPSTKRILGYDPADLVGKNMFDYIHPDERQEAIERFQKRVRSEIVTQITENRFKHYDGSWCALESTSENLLTHPAVRGFVINSRNISKQKLAQEALKKSHLELEHKVQERTRELFLLNQTLNNELQERKTKEIELEKANQTKNEFLAKISHEIKTPLNSIIGFSEVLSTMIHKNQEEAYLSAIRKAGKNLLYLINDILDLSKMEAGKLEIHKSITSIHMLLEDICQLFKGRIEEKDLVFVKDLDDQLPPYLLVDDIRVQQILVNLIDNAVKFTDKGHIKLSIRSIKNSRDSRTIDLCFCVEDTGIGINENNLKIIFESFQQTASNISRQYGGSGLGLSICKHLAELMGGQIGVTSRQGEGSIFTLVLPGIEIISNAVEMDGKEPGRISDVARTAMNLRRVRKPMSVDSLKKRCVDNTELKNQIRSNIFHLIPEIQEGFKIADIHIITQNMIHIGQQFHLPELTEFGQNLSQSARFFDIERLNSDLKQLFDTLKQLV